MNNLNAKELLKTECETCNIHVDRIQKALVEIKKMQPLSLNKYSIWTRMN